MPDGDTDSRISDELGALTRELGIELRVSLGLKVTVRDLTADKVTDYRVMTGGQVTDRDADTEATRVSRNSPVGHALLNACQGQEVTVPLPGREDRYRVLRVHVEGTREARQLVAWTLGMAADACLGDLPWVFAADPEQALRQARCSPVRGADPRSIQLKEPWALVAAPSDATVETRGDHTAVVDILRTGTRRLWRVRGKVGFLTADGSLTKIEAVGPSDSTSAEYELHGKRHFFGRERTPAFLGLPALRKRQDGKLQDPVAEQDLQWKPDLPGSVWQPVPSAEAVIGFGAMRYVEEGVVRRSVQLCILPEEAAMAIRPSPDPRRGEVWLLGFGNVEAEVEAPSGVRVVGRNEGRNHRLKLVAENDVPPRETTVALKWRRRDDVAGRAKLTVPFPREHVAFFGARGQMLAAGSVLTPQQLAGARVRVVAPEGSAFKVQGRYAGRDPVGIEPRRDAISMDVPATSPEQYSLDLAPLQTAAADALALGKDLNGAVKLTVGDAQGTSVFKSPSVAVMRFDLRLERRDDGSPLLDLDPPSRDKTTGGEVASLEVEALSLLDPDLKPATLERPSRTSWRVPEERLAPGPYLVVGRRESRQRFWPLIWQVGAKEPESRAPSCPQSAEEAHASAVGGLSAMAFRSLAVRMGAKPDHGDWELIFGYMREKSLPVQSFPLLLGLAETPRACATAAFVASGQEFELLWERMEEFRFDWRQVPHCCWRSALDGYAEDLREDLREAFGGADGFLPGMSLFDDRQHRELVASRVERLKARLNGLDDALDSWATDSYPDQA